MPPTRTTNTATTATRDSVLSKYGFTRLQVQRDRTTQPQAPVSISPQVQAYFPPQAPQPQPTQTPVQIYRSEYSVPQQPQSNVRLPAPQPIRAPEKVRPPVSRLPPQGEKDAKFEYEKQWQDERLTRLGSTTRTLTFGYGMALTRNHLDSLRTERPTICRNLWHFTYTHENAYYDSVNYATDLTDDCVVNFVRACPSLRTFTLEAATGLTDKSLIALCQYCPNLTTISLLGTGQAALKLTGNAFATILANPRWVPKLKELKVDMDSDKSFMKEMRNLSQGRQKLTVVLVKRSEVKKWGDWEIESYVDKYKNGRKAKDKGYGRGYGGFGYEDYSHGYGYY